MKTEKAARYRYLRLPLATPAEAAARRAYLVKVGVITPEGETNGESASAGSGK